MLAAAKTKEEIVQISKSGQKILQLIEDSKKPFIAAIKGSCLGGGLEVALACHYRLAMMGKKIYECSKENLKKKTDVLKFFIYVHAQINLQNLGYLKSS